MEIDKERSYVLLSVKWTRGSLIFWGTVTTDNAARRSFGGYTDDINICEKYTFEEARKESSHFHEYKGETLRSLKKIEEEGTWIIDIRDLDKLGRLVTHYVC